MSTIWSLIVPLCDIYSPGGVANPTHFPGGNPLTLHELDVVSVCHLHQITSSVLVVEHYVRTMEVRPTVYSTVYWF